MRSETRQIKRAPEDKARISSVRERYQRERPSLTKLVSSGDGSSPIPLGRYLERERRRGLAG
jgi:hypothetical protein